MIKLQNILTPVQNTDSPIITVANALKIDVNKIEVAQLYKRAIDARKKPNIFYCVKDS